MPSEELPGRRLTQVLHAGFADPTAGPQRRLDQASLVDSWLIELWQGAGAPASGAALAAIGSLGRRDLGPGSDLDLVLLVDTEVMSAEESARLASALWYPIWDSGTSLDHAMRSPLECEQVAREDLRAAISLLDLRLVAGQAELETTPRTACAGSGGAGPDAASVSSWTSPTTAPTGTAPSPTPRSRTSSPIAAACGT